MPSNDQGMIRPSQPIQKPKPLDVVQAKPLTGEKPQPYKFDIINLEGFIQTVTTAPTATPKTFYDSIKLYVDSISSPTVKRIYLYSREVSAWYYVALT